MDRRAFNKLLGAAGVSALTRRVSMSSESVIDSSAGETKGTTSRLWKHYLLGAAYYPEWWEPSEWEKDFRGMQELGINAVRMGEFAWALFEPAPGKFEFGWMDKAIAVASRHRIEVILATPTASVPPWLYQLHPDVLGGNETGPYTYGGRKGYCTNSQAYLDASSSITSALASHYGRHPGVIGWQLDNEPGYPFICYDPNSEHAFQDWLRNRYGTLEALNRAWNGAFWSNQYSDWTQIHFPKNSAEGGWQPAISLDYRRFFSDSFLKHLRRQATILHNAIKDQFVYTNWPSATWSVDVFAGAEFMDATAWDNYVSPPGLSGFQRQYIAGLNHDFCRCAGPNQRFLCGEQIAYVPANALDQGLRLQAYMDLAHGSHGHLYFEWRRPLAGGEQYRPSLIKQFDGSINPAKPVLEQIAKEFANLGPRLSKAVTRSDIALLYDFSNQWTQGFGSQVKKDRHYDGEAYRYYNGFKVLQRNIDIVPVKGEFSTYRLLVAPNLHMIDDASAQRLRDFVMAGGVLVLNYQAGTQNTDCSMRRVIPPGVFTEMAGVVAESNLDLIEHSAMDEKLKSELGIIFAGNKTIFRPHTILESVVLYGAEPIATFQGGRMAGRPAITRNRFGQGWVIYVGTDCAENEFHEELARAVGTIGRLSPLIAAPYGVEVVSREDSETVFYFLLNLTETPHGSLRLPRSMRNVLNSDATVTEVSLGPLDVVVLSNSKRDEGKARS